MNSVINLIKTNSGYSIVQGDTQINKNATRALKEKPYSAPKKFVQNFTIYPYISSQQKDLNHKFVVMPARTLWFSLNSVHEIEKKALPEWFKQRKVLFGTVKQEKFEKNEDLYKKYRNHIIELGREGYVSAFQARQGIAGDVCAIIRIHQFLQKWGLINYIYSKPKSKKNSNNQCAKTDKKSVNTPHLAHRKQCFQNDKVLISKSYNKEELQLLKKITRSIRPFCHYCDGVCGLIWYQYNEEIFLKQFTTQGITKSDKPFTYNLRLCCSCFNEGNLPLVLAFNNFEKKTILDNLEPLQAKDKRKYNQTKIIDGLQFHKLNFKKLNEKLDLGIENLFKYIIYLPIKKMDKLKKIQFSLDSDYQANEENDKTDDTNINGLSEERDYDFHQEKKLSFNQQNFNDKEKQIYEEFLQHWLAKTQCKLKKLATWDKAVNWNMTKCQQIQKQALADQLKNMIFEQ